MVWSLSRFRRNSSSKSLRSSITTRLPRTRLGLTLLEGRDVPSAVAIGSEVSIASGVAPNTHSRIAMAPGGRFAVAWQGTDAAGVGVFTRLYEADGSPITAVLPVNTTTAGDQTAPDIAMDDLGDFVVTWQGPDGSGKGIFAQRFGADGTARGSEFPVNVTTADDQKEAAVAMAPSGQSVFTWTSLTAADGTYDVYSRRFDADAVALDDHDVLVSTSNYQGQSGSRVAAYDGGYAVVWTGFVPSAGVQNWGFARAYNWDGSTRGVETRLSGSDTEPWSTIVSVGMDGSGKFVATFNQYGLVYTPDSFEFYAQRFDADGNRLGSSIHVNTTTQGTQVGDTLAVAADGAFTVAWSSNGPGSVGYDIYAQRFAADGTRIDGEFRANLNTTGDQVWPALAADAYGTETYVYAGTTSGATGIFAQQYAQPVAIDDTPMITTLKSYADASEILTVTLTVSAVGGSYLWDYFYCAC